jgi:hypothetical protein
MVTSVLLTLQALESGLAVLAWRRLQRDKVRARLVWGCTPSTRIPVLDEQLRTSAGTPTRTQVYVATGIVKSMRWITHTRAFELVVLKAVRGRWPKGKGLDQRVTLCLSHGHR